MALGRGSQSRLCLLATLLGLFVPTPRHHGKAHVAEDGTVYHPKFFFNLPSQARTLTAARQRQMPKWENIDSETYRMTFRAFGCPGLRNSSGKSWDSERCGTPLQQGKGDRLPSRSIGKIGLRKAYALEFPQRDTLRPSCYGSVELSGSNSP
jgi:hypothetical protein